MSETKTVSQFVKSRIEMVDANDEQHTARVRGWIKNWMFYRGNHYGDFDRAGNWVQLPDSQTEDLRFTDDFMFYCEAKATQWAQSEPELSIEPTCGDNYKVKAAIRHIEKELVKYRQNYWTPDFMQSMAKFAMLSTSYFIHTRPKLSEDSSIKIPSFSPKEIKGASAWFCEKCGEAGNGEMQTCPSCGSPAVSMPGDDIVAPYPSGMEELPSIDIDVELVDPMEIKLDPKCRAAKIVTADWMRRERYVRDYDVDAMYPNWREQSDNTDGPTVKSDVLDYKSSLEQNPAGLMKDEKSDRSKLLRRQYWFDPKTYKTYVVPADEVFAGVQFHKGEKFIEKYPKGLYVDQINSKFLKLFNESKNEQWVGGVDTIDPTSPYGRGFSGLVNLQEMLDEGVSLGFAYMMRDALGLTIYDPMMLEASDVESTRVGGALPLKAGAQIEGRPITAAMINVENKPLSPFTIPFLQMIDQKMPHAAGGAYDVLGGGGGVGAGAKTLGGQQDQLATATGMIGPALALRAQAEVEAFIQYLTHIQEFGSEEHYKVVAGEWGADDAASFREIKLNRDINIIPVANSEVPRTQRDRKENVAIAIQSGLANPQAPILEGVRRYGLEQLRIPVEHDPTAQVRRVAEALLEKMRQAAKYVQSMPNNGNIQLLAQAIGAVAPLTKQRDGDSLPIIKEVWQEALRSMVEDEDADQSLEAALMLKIDEIEQMDVGLAQDMSAKQVLAAAPMAIAQAKLEQEMAPEGEDAGEAAKAQAEAQMEQSTHESELEGQQTAVQAQLDAQAKEQDAMLEAQRQQESERQRQHESSEASAQREHDLKMAKIQNQQKATLAKQQAAKKNKKKNG